jgi:hypothetical protein
MFAQLCRGRAWRGAQSRGDGAGSVTDRRPSGFGSRVFLFGLEMQIRVVMPGS